MTASEAIKILNNLLGNEEPFPFLKGMSCEEALQAAKRGINSVLAGHGNIELSTYNYGGLEKRIRQLKESKNGKSK